MTSVIVIKSEYGKNNQHKVTKGKTKNHASMKTRNRDQIIRPPSKHKTKTKKSSQHQDTKQTPKIILALPASTTAILALIASSGRNKAHSKGTKLAETGRYLARLGRLTGVFPSLLRRTKIATPAKHRWREPLASALRMLLGSLLLISLNVYASESTRHKLKYIELNKLKIAQ